MTRCYAPPRTQVCNIHLWLLGFAMTSARGQAIIWRSSIQTPFAAPENDIVFGFCLVPASSQTRSSSKSEGSPG
jgi:hypothetical protein